MSSDDKIQEILTAVGSVAEMCKVFYNACIEQGFIQNQAMELTKQIPYAVFASKSESRGEES